MKVVSDEGALAAACDQVLSQNAKQVAEYRGGKKGILGYFVGQVMKVTKGEGDPKVVSQLLAKRLEEGT
jgi:aspartyl-tRNA(Asn)/glutamyl-tRNA(Gln) amidotransferase subunit B